MDASDRVHSSERLVRLRSEDDRRDWCGKRQRIEACTRIVAMQLLARAVERDGQYRLDASARFIALIGLQDMTRYGHEMLHVNDIRWSIDSYLVDLEKASFAGAAECEHARIVAIGAFEQRVRLFAEASNLLRDGAPHPER